MVNDLGGGRHGDGKSSSAADSVVEEIRRKGGSVHNDTCSLLLRTYVSVLFVLSLTPLPPSFPQTVSLYLSLLPHLIPFPFQPLFQGKVAAL